MQLQVKSTIRSFGRLPETSSRRAESFTSMGHTGMISSLL